MNLINLFAKITLDDSDYEKGLDKSTKSASSFSSKAQAAFKGVAKAAAVVTTVVTACAGALVKLTTATINQTSAIDDASKQLQITTTQYQEWDWIMKLIGADSSTLSMAFRQLATFTGNLASGNDKAAAAIQKLGLSTQDFLNLDTETRLTTIIQAFQNMGQSVEKTTLAQDVFGARAYQMLLPLLNDSAGSVDKLKDKVHEMGLVMSEDAVTAGAEMGDRLDIMSGAVKQLGYNLGVELFPALGQVVNGITALVTGTDGATDDIVNGLMGIVNKVVQKLPQIVDVLGALIVKLLQDLIPKLTELAPDLLNVIGQLLITVINALPDLLSSVGDLAAALMEGLLGLDWVTIMTTVVDKAFEITSRVLPKILSQTFDGIVDLISLDGLKDLGKLIAQTIVNAFFGAIESVINIAASLIGRFTKVFSKIGGAFGLPEIPEIPEISLPRISFFKNGGRLEDIMNGYGTAYAIAGEGNPEIVHQGSRGTGVETTADFENAMVSALMRVLGNTITLRIGDRDFDAYILKSVNSALKSQGRQSLDKLTRW